MDHIMGFAAYERVREQARQSIIELKRRRRLAVGDKVTLLFENRDTVIFQIQEMVRAEKIGDLDKIREEVEVYNNNNDLVFGEVQGGADVIASNVGDNDEATIFVYEAGLVRAGTR